MRLGKIIFTTHLLEKDEDEIAEALSQLKFLPYRVEHLLYSRELEMIGTSFRFEEVGENIVPPTYTIELTRSEDGEITVTDVKKAKT